MTGHARLRRTGVVALTLLGCLLAIVSLVAVWSRNQILDTDRYLASVTPLASDPVIQDEVAQKVSAAINQRLGATDLARDALPPRAAFLAAPLGAAVEQLVVRTTTDFVRSDSFARLWVELNRVGHHELVALLTDQQLDAVEVSGGRLRLDLTGVVQAVRDRIAQAGLTVVTTLPPITLVYDIADARGVEQARTAVEILDKVATWLPVLSLFLLLAAVAASLRRARTAVLVSTGLLAAMLLAHLGIAIGAGQAAQHVPESVASRAAVDAYYGHLTRLLHEGATLVGTLAALIGLGLLIALPFVAWARGQAAESSLGRHLRPVALLLAGSAVLLWPEPGTTTVVVLLGLGVAGFLALGHADELLGSDPAPSDPAPAASAP